ncbi:MAG: efflux RND transporter permease subunit [Candidatus Zixiibacteriota bacterium]
MILADVSIRRPVFATMMIVALVVLGLTSFLRLNIDLFPQVDFPFVVVGTVYPGASAEAVENDVTKKIEDAVNSIQGLEDIQSSSREGYSQVVLRFELEMDGKEKAQDVREKMSTHRSDLPQDIEEPVIQRFDPAESPIMSLAIAGDRSPRELTQIAKDKVKKRLESKRGVGAVDLVGGFEREIQVDVDIEKLAAYELSPFDIQNAIAAQNLEVPGGKINEGGTEFLVKTMGKFDDLNQLSNLVVATPEGQFVRLADVATVTDGVEESKSLSRLNGRRAVSLNIKKQSGGNTVDVANLVYAELEQLRKEIPEDVSLIVAQDNSVFTRDAVHDVEVAMLYGSILAVLVIFLFLADLRSTIISAIAIPTSIIATFTFMNALGFTLNFMTLLGLSLAVGLLIDDAIVVIENIYRHIEMGKPAKLAAAAATSEIGLAVTATTFSIVVVFLPVAYMKGIVGRFFYSFGMTVAFSVLVSLFVAFTLTPMLSSRWLKREQSRKGTRNPIYMATNAWNGLFGAINRRYSGILKWALGHRVITLLVATVAFIGGIMLYPLIGFEFMPQSDQSQAFVAIETAPGTRLEVSEEIVGKLEQIIRSHAEVTDVFSVIGGESSPINKGTMTIKLIPKDERDMTVAEFVQELRTELKQVPGVRTSIAVEAGHEGGQAPVAYSVTGDQEERVMRYTEALEAIVRNAPGAVDINNTLSRGTPELRINVDRNKIADLGLNMLQIGSAVRLLVEGDVVSRYKDIDDEYDIRLRVKETQRNVGSSLRNFLIPSSKEVEGIDDFQVPLSRVASIEKWGGPAEKTRFNRKREYRVLANVEGRFSGNVRQDVEAGYADIDMLPGYDIAPVGEGNYQKEAFNYIFESLILAIIFIYLLLASQFNHFLDPLSIMVSLPLSLVGAFLGLLAFGSSISIISLIGVIMLMGLVTKNAILLIDFTKQARARGLSRTEALLQSGPIRFRPIMMTTASMVFGVLPLALGLGPGAELRAPIARVVIGGLISSTALTLVVVPVVYTIFDDIAQWFGGSRRKDQELEKAADAV